LILQGKTDLQVNYEEALQLKKCNAAASIEIIEEMNHVLKTAKIDTEENYATYKNPDLPINDHLIESIKNFVQKNNKK
jgi:hypothetical protein